MLSVTYLTHFSNPERNCKNFRAWLRDVPGIHLVPHDEAQRQSYQYVVVEVDEREAGISRDALLAALWRENVFARRYFYPGCHRSEPYRTQGWGQRVFPATEWLSERVLVLPTGTSVGVSDVADVCEIIKRATGGKGDN